MRHAVHRQFSALRGSNWAVGRVVRSGTSATPMNRYASAYNCNALQLSLLRRGTEQGLLYVAFPLTRTLGGETSARHGPDIRKTSTRTGEHRGKTSIQSTGGMESVRCLKHAIRCGVHNKCMQ